VSYISVSLIVTVIALTAAVLTRRFNPKITPSTAIHILTVVITLTAVVYCGWGIFKYYALYFGLWDFGIYDSMLHNAVSGKGFMQDFRGPFDHFSPAVLLLVPWYWLFDSPYVLIFFQAIVLSAAALPLYFVAKQYFRDAPIPLLLSLMYLLNPYYSRIALYDFHIESLFPLVFFCGWLALCKRKMLLFCILMLSIPMIKEELIIPLAAAGTFLLLQKRTRMFGIILIVAGLCWGIFVLKVWFPLTMTANYQHYSRFPEIWNGSLSGAVNNIFYTTVSCFTPRSLMVWCSVVLPFAFLPLLNWRAALFLLCPVVLIQFCTTFPHQQLLMSHYSSAVIAVAPVAAIYGLRTLRIWCRSGCPKLYHFWIRTSLWIMIGAHITFCELPFVTYHNYIHKYVPEYQLGLLSLPLHNFKFLNLEHPMLFHELRKQIPPQCSIAAQNNLGNHFLRTNRVYRLPGQGKCDLYIFDAKTFVGLDSEITQTLFNQLSNSPEYSCVFKSDGIYLFCRNKTSSK
jgi:uncharacterized membrane protein